MPAKQGNQTATKHAVEGAIKRLNTGDEMLGIALQAEQQAREEYELNGAVSLIEKDAARHQAAADLCFAALQAAAQQGNAEQVDKFLQRFGWLNAGAARLWEMVSRMRARQDTGPAANSILDAYRDKNDNDS